MNDQGSEPTEAGGHQTTGRNPVWNRDELILALDLYVKHQASLPGPGHPDVIELSKLLNQIASLASVTGSALFRNANGVAMKLQNFRRLDPTQDGKGLQAGGRGEAEVWDTFYNDRPRLTLTANAIRGAVGAVQQLPSQEPEEGTDAEEGRVLTRLHRYRERDRSLVARRKAKALKDGTGLKCEVCNFDFERCYGVRGRGFIECHHTLPVSKLEPGDRTRVDDLALLCSNCHRMIHAQAPWLTVAELRSVLNEQQPQTSPKTGSIT